MYRGDPVHVSPGQCPECSLFGLLDFSFIGFVMVLPRGCSANRPSCSNHRDRFPELDDIAATRDGHLRQAG